MDDDPRTSLRRIVTGLDADGRSCVALEGPPAPILHYGEKTGLFECWTDDGGPLDNRSPPPMVDQVLLCPPAKGIKLRWFTIAPQDANVSPAELEQAYQSTFERIGAPDARPDTRRHPAMHLTQTLDFIVVVRGRVRLLLDREDRVLSPGDIVVQRATNHAWICEGDEPALLVACLVDKGA